MKRHLQLSIKQLSSRYSDGSISPRIVVDHSLDDAVKLKRLNAFIRLSPEKALHQAKESDHRYENKEQLGILDGVPIAIKDNFCTKEVTTTCASRMLSNFVPPFNATVCERLANAGAVLIGKTNMDQFAMGSGTVDSIFGPSKNIWSNDLVDKWHIAGGSSGGSATAVAAGICYAMLPTHQQLTPNNRYAVIIAMPAIIYTLLFTLPSTLAGGYTINSDRLSKPTSAMASKVLFHSPSLANIYKEMIVSSKPLSLRKYGNGSKVKKTKKDSKIYYIPIPPMPYRYVPGVGFDYQPMKIKPIEQKEALPSSGMNPLNEAAQTSSSNAGKATTTVDRHTATNQKTKNNLYRPVDNGSTKYKISNKKEIDMVANRPLDFIGADSKLYLMDRGNYYFSGRPFRLQVAHAQPKNQLTSLNLKSKLYFNKKIIY